MSRSPMTCVVLVALLVGTACAPVAIPAPAPTPRASAGPATPTKAPAPTVAPDVGPVYFSRGGWKTDFGRHSVPLSEVSPGGPPRDGIPPLDHPKFETIAQADGWLKPAEPVIALDLGGDARAYPLQVLIWHEIANDVVAGVPVTVAFCPLCNTAIAFDRRLDGQVLDFGTTGNLRDSDLVMWDRQTESWWQQLTGEAIVGELTGKHLAMLPATIVSWAEFRGRYPAGQVLSRATGFLRDYGRNPYVGYDRIDQPPFLFQGTPDGRLPPMERVVTVSRNNEDLAVPYSILRQRRVVEEKVGGREIVVVYQPGTTSALDGANIATSRDVGAAAVYEPAVDGRHLTFTWQSDAFVDQETGTLWTLLGQATTGPLAGKRLAPVPHLVPFWFAWAAFKPSTRIAR
jgi:Protein of unknown function (DUF3179)